MATKTKIDLKPAEAVALTRLAADHKDIASEMAASTTEAVDFMLRIHGNVSKAKNTSAKTKDSPSGPEVVAWIFSKLSPDARLKLTTLFAEEVKAGRARRTEAGEAAHRAYKAAEDAAAKPDDLDLAAIAKAMQAEAEKTPAPKGLFAVDQNCLLQARQMIDLAVTESIEPRSGATKAHLTIENVDIFSLKPSVLKQISESSRTIVFE